MATPEENREADIKTREALMTPEERAGFPLPPSDVASPNYVPTSTNQGIGGDLSVPETTQFNADQSRGTATVEYMREQAKQEKEEADRLKKEKEAAEKEQEKAPGTFQKFAESLGFKSEQDKRAEAEETTGIKPAEYFAERAAEIAEMDALYTDYNNTVARRDQALLSKEEQMGGYLGSILDGEKSIINKAYNIELSRKSAQINTKLAIMEMKQENFAEAQAFIDDAVNDYMAPIKDDYAVFQQFREEQADKIAGLDNEYKEAMDKQDAYKLAILQEEESRVTQVGEMMKQYFNAGITLDDTVAEANEKAARWSANQPAEVTQYAPAELTKEWTAAGGLEGTGMSQFEYNAWRTGMGESLPRNWGDDEIRTDINGLKDTGKTYEEVLNEISMDTTIQNKDKAREIAAEVFGIEEPEEAEKPGVPTNPSPVSPDYKFIIGPEGGVVLNPLYVE